ncbi:MAG: hypothetical protein HC860_01270 [Alkalinema sp. RU_4_3]|nr:hypothetical protein [Alkalinema sp. RU_4_3]
MSAIDRKLTLDRRHLAKHMPDTPKRSTLVTRAIALGLNDQAIDRRQMLNLSQGYYRRGDRHNFNHS